MSAAGPLSKRAQRPRAACALGLFDRAQQTGAARALGYLSTHLRTGTRDWVEFQLETLHDTD
jgi:hypothetical protein